LQCAKNTALPCTLTGTNLFLLDAVASDVNFSQGMQVPDGFAGSALQVPHPSGASLYVKLRDDPSAVNTVVLPPKPLPQQALSAPAQQHAVEMPVSAQQPAEQQPSATPKPDAPSDTTAAPVPAQPAPQQQPH